VVADGRAFAWMTGAVSAQDACTGRELAVETDAAPYRVFTAREGVQGLAVVYEAGVDDGPRAWVYARGRQTVRSVARARAARFDEDGRLWLIRETPAEMVLELWAETTR